MKNKLIGARIYYIAIVIGLICLGGQTAFPQAVPESKLPPVHYIRSHDFDVRHIALNLKFDWEKEQAYGTATLTLASFVPNLKTIDLDAGLMIINSVKLTHAKSLTFNYDEKESRLSVNLDRAYKVGESITIVVDYRTKGVSIENSLGFGGGGGLKFTKPTPANPTRRKQVWSQGESDFNRFWFPSYDSPNDFATSELTATVEKPMFVVSNGKLLTRTDNRNGTETFHWKMDIPHANYLTSIVVGEYAEVKGEYLGVPISTYVFPNEQKEGGITAKRLPAMVKFFSEKTGVKYPYPKYAQTMATDFNGGMENISATTMTPSMIHDARTELDNDSDSLQSHELAHQWFGDYVTTREWSDIWLNESFATYFQALWDEESKGHEFFLYSDVRSNQQQYYATWNSGNRRPVVTKHYSNADALFDTYAYPRGGAVLHMLRKHLGDELFFKSLNHYLTVNANKPVQTEQLRIAVEEATGQSMDWFFDQWIYKMGHPIFEVKQNYDEAGKKLTLTVKQTQNVDPNNHYPQVEFFQARVDVEIGGRVEQVWLKPQTENVFIFDASAKPKLVNFDYEGTMIKEIKFDKSNDELTYQAKSDKDVLGRVWAMNQLAARWKSKDTSDADKATLLPILNRMITGDPLWLIRRDAVLLFAPQGQGNQFGGLPQNSNQPAATLDPATIVALTAAVSDKSAPVRSAAIAALGSARNEKFAEIFLVGLNDQSYGVIGASANALAATKSAKAFDALSKLIDSPSWQDRIRLSALRALADLGDKRALDIGFKFADKSYPANVRSAAVNIVAANGKGDARSFPLVMENFQTALSAGSIQAAMGALRGFIQLGDPRGQQAFDQAKEKFKSQANFAGLLSNLESQFKKAVGK